MLKSIRNLVYKCMIKLGIPLFNKKEMKVIKDALEQIEKENSDKDVAN